MLLYKNKVQYYQSGSAIQTCQSKLKLPFNISRLIVARHLALFLFAHISIGTLGIIWFTQCYQCIFCLQARLQEKPCTQSDRGDISPFPSSGIPEKPDGSDNRELLKLKDMLTQRDNEISILHLNCTALLRVVGVQFVPLRTG